MDWFNIYFKRAIGIFFIQYSIYLDHSVTNRLIGIGDDQWAVESVIIDLKKYLSNIFLE